jgi:hypothetical protein
MLKHHRRSSPGTSSASMSCCRRRPQLGMESPCSANAGTEGTDSAFAKSWRGQVTPGEIGKKCWKAMAAMVCRSENHQ